MWCDETLIKCEWKPFNVVTAESTRYVDHKWDGQMKQEII